MNIETSGTNVFTVLLVLVIMATILAIIAILGATGSLSLHIFPSPAEYARATVIAQFAPTQTAQALQATAAAQQVELALAIRRAPSRQLLADAGAIAAVAAIAVLLSGLTWFWFSWLARRRSQPATVEIAPYLVIVFHRNSAPVLVDTLTGRLAPLSSAGEVDQLRTAAMTRLLLAEQAARAAVDISHFSASPAPADWLPLIANPPPNPPILKSDAPPPPAVEHLDPD